MHPMINTDPDLIALLPIVGVLATATCTQHEPQTLITIADARTSPAQFIDTGEPGDSVGDLLTFDQPLLDEDMQEIGNNCGSMSQNFP